METRCADPKKVINLKTAQSSRSHDPAVAAAAGGSGHRVVKRQPTQEERDADRRGVREAAV